MKLPVIINHRSINREIYYFLGCIVAVVIIYFVMVTLTSGAYEPFKLSDYQYLQWSKIGNNTVKATFINFFVLFLPVLLIYLIRPVFLGLRKVIRR